MVEPDGDSSIQAAIGGKKKSEAGLELRKTEGSNSSSVRTLEACEPLVIQPSLLPPWRLVPIWAGR